MTTLTTTTPHYVVKFNILVLNCVISTNTILYQYMSLTDIYVQRSWMYISDLCPSLNYILSCKLASSPPQKLMYLTYTQYSQSIFWTNYSKYNAKRIFIRNQMTVVNSSHILKLFHLARKVLSPKEKPPVATHR